LDREFEKEQTEPSDMLKYNKEHGSKIDIFNRYLMLCKDAPTMKSIELGKGFDLHRILGASIRKGTHIHEEESRVKYYMSAHIEEDGQRCVIVGVG